MTLIVIIALVVIVVLWVISVQRNLVSKDELCKNSLSQIGVQQASRWDALTALAELTKSYSEHEYNTLRDVIAQRKVITGNSSVQDVNEQEKLLSGALSRLIAVSESYPDLKADETYLKTMDSVNLYENQVRMSRMVYNDAVTAFNRLVRQFPNSLISGMLGFATKEYLVENTGKDQMPSMKL